MSAPSVLSLDRVMDALSTWLDTVAGVVTDGLGRLGRNRGLALTEAEDGTFVPAAGAVNAVNFDLAALVKGRDVTLALDPGRFLFRPLELPQGAAPYLEGIVRAQIDRLTPWSAADACYGWSAPRPSGEDHLRLVVAATAQAQIAPVLERLKALGARTVVIITRDPEQPDAAPVRIADAAGSSVKPVAAVRQALFVVLAAGAVLALASLIAADWGARALDAELAEIEAATSTARHALLAARDGSGPEAVALRDLEKRKHSGVPVVLVLEALSQTLPDNTYVTALETEGAGVQIMGVSQDAPALIAIMEQSGHFAQATFASPTTRDGAEAGARFHITAELRPWPEPKAQVQP